MQIHTSITNSIDKFNWGRGDLNPHDCNSQRIFYFIYTLFWYFVYKYGLYLYLRGSSHWVSAPFHFYELAQDCSLQFLGKTFSEFENLQINAQNLSPLCLPFHHAPLCYIKNKELLKAAPRFELGIEDLQSTALPLGDAAFAN